MECGLSIPADENAKPGYVEYEGELYWVNINRRGEIWINLRDKPQPVFRIVQGKRLEGADEPAIPAAPAAPAGETPARRSCPASGTPRVRRAKSAISANRRPSTRRRPRLRRPSSTRFAA
ncbi:MAG: hypothetical protein WDM96_10070 [Lacunisphaera sp.]